MTRYIIVGAGAVGASIAAQLHQGGAETLLIARGAHLAALREHGLRYVRPGGEIVLRLPVAEGPAEVELQAGDVLVLATKSQDTEQALQLWAAQPVKRADGSAGSAAQLPVVTVQNGLANERTALRFFDHVLGAVIWIPASYLNPGEVVNPAAPDPAVIWLGAYPGQETTSASTGDAARIFAQTNAHAERVATDLRRGGLAVQVVADIERWKAGKLLGNLINALDALYPPSELRATALTALHDETRAVFAAAGIEAADLRAESTVDLSGFRVVPIPGRDRGGSSTWQSLARASAPETEYLNGEVVLQARLHGTTAPLNAAIRDRVRRAVAEATPAGTLDDADLAATLPGLHAEPATTEPQSTDPAETEPTTADPAANGPATTKPATTKPATTEPATNDPTTNDPTTNDPATTAPATTAAGALGAARPAETPLGEDLANGGAGKAGLDCCSPSLRTADQACPAAGAAGGETEDVRVEKPSVSDDLAGADDPRGRVLVGVHELYRSVAGADAPVLLDVRWALGDPLGADHYRAGHLPGAVFVDLDTELAGPHASGAGRHPLPEIESLQENARRWGVTRKRGVVVYDNSGGLAAARAWWLLRWAGVPDVRILDGGLGAWAAAGYGQATGDARPRPEGDIALSPGHLPTLTADEAAELANSGVLLDARAGERYRGEVEPIDPRAGHIPGAVSAPTSENLTDGAFRSTAELRERFAGLIGEGAAVGVYCGSGVTASHEIAALAVAGIDAALYPGSWSAWSSDAARPVATT